MRFSAALVGVLLPLSALAEPANDKTLSPYFFVEKGDPAVDRLPLESTSVKAGVSGVIADVTVTQVYKNDGKRPLNARYVFPASTRAAVHGLKMTIGDKVVEAKIKERGEAKRTFEKAKAEGKSASLLEEDRPNVFTMSLANVMPGDRISVELRYTELLVPEDGTYELVYPTVVGPRYAGAQGGKPAARVGTGEHDGFVASPYTHAGQPPASTFDLSATLSSGIPFQSIASPSHRVAISKQGETLATIALDPSEKLGGNKDFVLRYRLAGDQVQSGLLLYESKGESFFLLMAEPPARVKPEMIPPREYVFIVDISGSMHGFPLDTAKALLRELVGGLRPSDKFNVILFAGSAGILAERSVPASRENVEAALEVIDGQEGGGGTELLGALQTALALPEEKGWSRTFVAVTDGYVTVEPQAFETIRSHLGHANFFAFGIGTSVNRYLIEGLARAGAGEPFVVENEKDGEAAAARFRAYVSAPVLTDVELSFSGEGGFQAYDVEPPAIPDVLARRPVIVHGKFRGPLAGKVTLRGVSGQGRYEHTMDIASARASADNRALPYLWARTRIANLSDFGAETEATKAEIVKLGLAYNLLTKHTSFVAVLETIRNQGAPGEDVDQPLPMPVGVSDLAMPIESGDEPGLVVLAALLAAAGLVLLLRRRVGIPR